MEFRILGPLEVVRDDGVVPLHAPKLRALLSLLLLHPRGTVPTERLIDDLWAGRPPVTAAKTLQSYVSALRKALGREAIATRPGGYELRAEGDSLDVERFERIDADLASGAAAALVPELGALVEEHPLREHLRLQLMLALYRSGRQADALAAYRAAREALVDRAGIDPGPALRE